MKHKHKIRIKIKWIKFLNDSVMKGRSCLSSTRKTTFAHSSSDIHIHIKTKVLNKNINLKAIKKHNT